MCGGGARPGCLARVASLRWHYPHQVGSGIRPSQPCSELPCERIYFYVDKVYHSFLRKKSIFFDAGRAGAAEGRNPLTRAGVWAKMGVQTNRPSKCPACAGVKGNRVQLPSDPVTVNGERAAAMPLSRRQGGVRRRGKRRSVSQETCLERADRYLPQKETCPALPHHR